MKELIIKSVIKIIILITVLALFFVLINIPINSNQLTLKEAYPTTLGGIYCFSGVIALAIIISIGLDIYKTFKKENKK